MRKEELQVTKKKGRVKEYKVIGGFEVKLCTRVGRIERIRRFGHYRRVLVLPFRRVLPLPGV